MHNDAHISNFNYEAFINKNYLILRSKVPKGKPKLSYVHVIKY